MLAAGTPPSLPEAMVLGPSRTDMASPHGRVDHGVEDVGDGRQQHGDRDDRDHRRLDHRDVPVVYGVVDQPAHARDAEDDLDHDGAAQQPTQPDREQSDDRDEGVPDAVPQDGPVVAESPCPGAHDVRRFEYIRDAAREVYRRLMDAVDPELVDQTEQVIRSTPGVVDVSDIQLLWLGHSLRAEARITVDSATSLIDAHHISHQVEHELVQGVRRLTSATIHAEPLPHDSTAAHDLVGHHR